MTIKKLKHEEYWLLILKRTCKRIRNHYGWNKGTGIDLIMWTLGISLVLFTDYRLRGLSEAIGEFYAFSIYFFIVGVAILFGRLIRMFVAEPRVLNDEKDKSIQDLEGKLEDKYTNTSLSVDKYIYEKTTPEQWIGLKIENKENFGIEKFYVQIMKVEDEDNKNVIVAPFIVDWSSLNPPDLNNRLPRESCRYFDIACTSSTDNFFQFVNLGGGRRFPTKIGSYVLNFVISGSVNNNDIKPQHYSCLLEYLGSDKLTIGDVKRDNVSP